MININLTIPSQIILNGIFDKELDKQIRENILENIPDDYYDISCEVFHKARETYLDLGFEIRSSLL